MASWLKALKKHHRQVRKQHETTKLVLLFRIDGVIFDFREVLIHALRAYDAIHETDFSQGLRKELIQTPSLIDGIDYLLQLNYLTVTAREEIKKWIMARISHESFANDLPKPLNFSLDVLKWFISQQMTEIRLLYYENTYPDHVIRQTIESNLRRKRIPTHSVRTIRIPETKPIRGLSKTVEQIEKEGRKVISFVDWDYGILEALANTPLREYMLFVHFSPYDTTGIEQQRVINGLVREGAEFRLSSLITKEMLPAKVQLVWHGVNSQNNLRQFLDSNIRWAEIDVRDDIATGELILRHDGLEETPLHEEEQMLRFRDTLHLLLKRGRNVKIDFKTNRHVFMEVIDILQNEQVPANRLWFNSNIDCIGKKGFRTLREIFPSSIIQIPAEGVAPILRGMPEEGERLVAALKDIGINRFSFGWFTPHLGEILNEADRMGLSANIYGVFDLDSFLQAVLMEPASVTADFNFPEWHMFGQGAGHKLEKYEYLYRLKKASLDDS